MSQDCLLLNGNGKPVSFFPLSVINWKTAVKLLLAKNVILVKEYDNKVVRSPSIEIPLPSILMLKRFHKFHNYVRFSRSNVFLRDIYTCQYCKNIHCCLNIQHITWMPLLLRKQKIKRKKIKLAKL